MKKEKQLFIYDGLFQLVNENLQASGGEMEFKKETFLSTVGESGQITDISEWRDFENDVFLEVAYLKLLERLPDKMAISIWKGKMGKAKKEVHAEIITSILSSQEYLLHNTYAINNIYSPVRQKKVSLRFGIREFMYRVYKKFPEPVKQVIRKMLKVY
ncbi:MAG: hypothetical protein ACRDBO_02835 [Lachnospiraceae bacterium]